MTLAFLSLEYLKELKKPNKQKNKHKQNRG